MMINLELDDEIKNQFDMICKQEGLLSDMAVTCFVKTVVSECKIPFMIGVDPNYRRNKLKECVAKRFKNQIEMVLENYSEEKCDALKEKILEDICDIEETTNFIPFEYFRMHMYLMDKKDWMNEYLADSDTYVLADRLNNKNMGLDVSNKYEIYKFYEQYYKRDVICVRNTDDLSKFYRLLVKHKKVLIKPLRGSLGQGVEVVSIVDVRRDRKFLEKMLTNYPQGILVEELIDQHPVMTSLNPPSSNTLRIMTVNLGDEIRTYPALRIGTTNSITDALTRGGLTGKVDVNTGEILEVRNSAGKTFTTNPGCGAQLVGVKIPDIQGAISLAKELAAKMPEYRYIGFDIALSKKGWVMIEFNGKSGIACVQTALGHGLKQEFIEIFEKLGQSTDFPKRVREKK